MPFQTIVQGIDSDSKLLNSVNGAHTQNVESMRLSAKYQNSKECKTHREMLDSSLCELMWWKQLADKDLFMEIIHQGRLSSIIKQ